MAEDITSYIAEAKKLKVSDVQIKATLLSAGWKEKEIDAALSDTPNKLQVPQPPVAHIGMWTGFLYLLLFIALYTLATSLAGIFHAGVEKFFPNNDIDNWYALFKRYNETIIRGYIAAIIVSYPIFITLWFTLSRQIRNNPAIRNLRSRKLLIYITLVVTFIILMWQIISALFSFLNGNLTSNSIAHSVVTLFIAGGIFTYFITEVKHDSKEQ